MNVLVIICVNSAKNQLRRKLGICFDCSSRKMAEFAHPTAETVQENLRIVSENVRSAYDSADVDQKQPEKPPRIVAVSKLKPVELIRACYDAGHRVFGENYVQEMIEKAESEEILANCPEIRWHFIGNLQTNKIGKVCSSIPRLSCVETIDSEKMATALNSAWEKHQKDNKELAVMVQVREKSSIRQLHDLSHTESIL